MNHSPPNIVLITAHDLGRYLGCYGVKTVRSPNLDSLAGEGVRFANAFTASSECSPSWAALFTGRYPHCNGVMGRSRPHFAWALHEGEKHLAQALKPAGYLTAAIGVNEICEAAVTRTESFIAPSSRDQGPAKNSGCGFDQIISAERGEEVAAQALSWLDEFAETGKPFYLQIGFLEAHRQASPDPEESDFVGFLGDYLSPDRSLGVTVPECVLDTPAAREELAELQGAICYLDTQIGKLLDAIHHRELEGETLVVFTTDHGLAVPRCKGSLLDSGLETALILRWPKGGWKGGRVFSELVSNLDVFPTIVECAGLPVDISVQGQSLKALLDGEQYHGRDHLFAEMNYHDYYEPIRCVRTGSHKLILNFSNGCAQTDPSESWRPRMSAARPANSPGESYHPLYELYDLSTDPGEWRNIVDDPENGEIRGRLLKLLRDWMQRTRDPLLAGAVISPFHRWAVGELAAAGDSAIQPGGADTGILPEVRPGKNTRGA